MRTRRALSACVAIAAVALTACVGPQVASSPTQANLDFAATTVDGEQFDGTSLAGRPAVLWFWAPWCPTCVAEAPDVLDLAARYAGAVSVIGVASLGGLDQMHSFIELTKTDGLTHLADESGAVWRRFEVRAQSTYVLLDDSGSVVFSGFLSGGQLADRVDRLAG